MVTRGFNLGSSLPEALVIHIGSAISDGYSSELCTSVNCMFENYQCAMYPYVSHIPFAEVKTFKVSKQ